MGVGAAIAACSGPSQTAPSKPASTATKAVQHTHGETQVPINPTRIVVLDFFTLEALLALGVEPIAAPGMMFNNFLHLPPTSSEMADIGNPREPSLEQIAALQPDLILSSKNFTTADTYALLSQVAPTVVFDFEDGPDWQTLPRLCGEALGKEAEVKQLEADYAAKLKAFQDQLPQAASQIQVSVASFFADNGIYAFGKETFTGAILADAGVSRPPQQAEGEGARVSIERLSDIDGDVLFVVSLQSETEIADDMQAALDQIKSHPLWAKLKVVEAQRVYEVGPHWFGMGYIAANLMLDDLLTHMGNPA
ncbi:MAG: iron-siderophore ABC transporter substrate-binding protein [Symploca sp. SIO2G7]|nr:iron-siderophore ABC transporter substrate-binding protein [Symploca sp. SIO2G7]